MAKRKEETGIDWASLEKKIGVRLAVTKVTAPEESLREVIRNLEENNRARYAEIEQLRKQIKALKARLTRMQGNVERKNKGQPSTWTTPGGKIVRTTQGEEP
jgi:uncharacterized protein HemX